MRLLATVSLLLAFFSTVFSSPRLLSRREFIEEIARREAAFEDGAGDPSGEVYAVLVAGSNGWFNYRHQADVAHAYQGLRRHGVKADNIITMMYDDIAHNKQNPFPGKLYNNPEAKDVYEGIQIDYKGKDVTPANFISVLTGNKTGVVGGNRRVLESGPQDRVFVYFTDHGAPGLIAFPEGILTVKDLNKALNDAKKAQKFDIMLFYLEACESGSMFENVLSPDLNVFAVTAANGKESSWGTYCENKLGLPCLGDLFSVSWMEDSDIEDLNSETVEAQFELVRKETNKSHVMKFGTDGIGSDPVAWFQGMKKNFHRKQLTQAQKDARVEERLRTAVPSRDIEEYYLKKTILESNDQFEQRRASYRLHEIEKHRAMVKRRVKSIVHILTLDESLPKAVSAARRAAFFSINGPVLFPDCHDDAIYTFDFFCFKFSEYEAAMRYAFVLNNACNALEGDSDRVVNAILDGCSSMRMNPERVRG